MTPPTLAAPPEPPRCWCGHAPLADFSPDYWRCPECETLVGRSRRGEEISRVRDDEQDFYGKNYYLRRLREEHGQPDLASRARADLPERCLHWLRTLLKFAPGVGARTLELGCGHGGFVALQRWAGLDATGLELSPWLVAQARAWFGVPVLEGRLEDQTLPAGAWDAVILMDVLEHLPDPRETLRRAAALLRGPESFLLIQTPCYPAGMSYEALREQNHPFLTQFKPVEHLYLFSQGALRRLCAELGLGQVRFEPPVFAHYDLFAAASAGPLPERSAPEQAARLLAAPPPARLALALLDLAEARDGLHARAAALAAERDGLLRLVQERNEEAARLHATAAMLWPRLDAAENARNLALAQRDELQEHFTRSEADRAARLAFIEHQGQEEGRLHAEAERWRRQAAELGPQLDAERHAHGLRAAELAEARARLERAEAERAALSAEAAEARASQARLTRELAETRARGQALADHWTARGLRRIGLGPRP